MKTAELLRQLQTGEWVHFTTKQLGAFVNVQRRGQEPDTVRVYVGDGFVDADYVYMKADDLRELAKKLKAIAAAIDPEV